MDACDDRTPGLRGDRCVGVDAARAGRTARRQPLRRTAAAERYLCSIDWHAKLRDRSGWSAARVHCLGRRSLQVVGEAAVVADRTAPCRYRERLLAFLVAGRPFTGLLRKRQAKED